MTSTSVLWCNVCLAHCPKAQSTKQPSTFLCAGRNVKHNLHSGGRKSSQTRRTIKIYRVLAVTKGSAESNKSEESLPSWARPDSEEPPPWARDDGKEGSSTSQSFELPYIVYLLASAVTAIDAIGSIFEYANKRPAFGVLGPDSMFYAPLLGFFVIAGIPTCKSKSRITMSVVNRGDITGKHPMLLFLRRARARGGILTKQLVNFQSIELKVGEKVEIEFKLHQGEHLSRMNEDCVMVMEEESHFLVVEIQETLVAVVA